MRINAFAQAMRAVDPTIKIGIALSNDKQNGLVATAATCQGFTATVLNGLTQPVDFISLHDAYLPYDPSGTDHPAADYYWAAMASTQSIAADFAAMRTLLQGYPALASLPFAITEYNAVFSFNSSSAYYYSMASPMGALYVADALRFFASNDSVLMANTWSLSGNDHWGAIHPPSGSAAPYGRPTYEVFRLFAQALQGIRLTATVDRTTLQCARHRVQRGGHRIAAGHQPRDPQRRRGRRHRAADPDQQGLHQPARRRRQPRQCDPRDGDEQRAHRRQRARNR